jgi:hypothetical protein
MRIHGESWILNKFSLHRSLFSLFFWHIPKHNESCFCACSFGTCLGCYLRPIITHSQVSKSLWSCSDRRWLGRSYSGKGKFENSIVVVVVCFGSTRSMHHLMFYSTSERKFITAHCHRHCKTHSLSFSSLQLLVNRRQSSREQRWEATV